MSASTLNTGGSGSVSIDVAQVTGGGTATVVVSQLVESISGARKVYLKINLSAAGDAELEITFRDEALETTNPFGGPKTVGPKPL